MKHCSRLNCVLPMLLLAIAAPGVEAGEIFSDRQLAAAEQLIDAALTDDRAYRMVESLTTGIGPRLAGTPAEAMARDWAVRELEARGFDDVRVETFETPGWLRGDETLELLRQPSQQLAVTALGFSTATPPEGLVADVAYFGSLREIESAAAAAVEGRIAFIDSYLVPTMDGSGVSVAYRTKSRAPNIAARKGAVAALIRSIASGNDRFPHTGTFGYEQGVPRIPVAAVAVPDAEQIARLARRDEALRARLTLTTEDPGMVESGNVLAEIPGDGSTDELVLIGAHLDSWDLGTGAVDDASGVAVAIAVADLIRELGLPIRRSIRVVLFGAEETTLGGAKDYAKRHAAELDRHAIAVESDFGAEPVWALYSNVPEPLLPVIDRIGEVIGPRFGIVRRHNQASGGEDLTYIREQGVPVVSLVQDGIPYFDLHHTANDTLDKIDPDALRQNVAAFGAFVYLAAGYPDVEFD